MSYMEFYTPAYRSDRNLGLGKNVPIKINEQVIKELMAIRMYTHATAGLRELYANAVNACMTAKEKGASPSIEITIDEKKGKVILLEKDSMGMSREVFENIYCVLGQSGNFDGTKPGMFGVGMMAYCALSNDMLIESYSRETGEQMTFLSNGMNSFEDVSSTNKPTLNSYGIKIDLTLRISQDDIGKKDVDDESIHDKYYKPLIKLVEHMGKFSGIDTWMININADWRSETNKIGLITPEEYLGEKPTISIENEDYMLDLVAGGHKIMTLAKMPVTNDEKILASYGYVLQVKNERDYMPTVSRDSFTAEASKRLHTKIFADLADVLSKQSDDIRDWFTNRGMMEIFNTFTWYLNVSYYKKLYEKIGAWSESYEAYTKIPDKQGHWGHQSLIECLVNINHNTHIKAINSGNAWLVMPSVRTIDIEDYLKESKGTVAVYKPILRDSVEFSKIEASLAKSGIFTLKI